MVGLIRLIFGILILYLAYRVIRRFFLPGAKRVEPLPKQGGELAGEDLVEDPVCHTYVPMTHARVAVIDGKKLYFCSAECLNKYQSQEKP